MELRLECPTCKTSYTGARCGIPDLQDWQSAKVTVRCMVCSHDFNAVITPREVEEALNWWRRVVLRQQPEKRVDGHEVAIAARE